MKKNTLWTHDFRLIVLVSVLSAIAGEAVMIPLSLEVFDKTESTFSSALLVVSGVLPDVIFAPLLSPIIERISKKKLLLVSNLMLMATYFYAYIETRKDFSFTFYILFSLLIATNSIFYQIAYQSFYVDLIPIGQEQKGHSVMTMIYPVVLSVTSPLSSLLFTRIEMHSIFLLVIFILLPTLPLILMIRYKEEKKIQKTYGIRKYMEDIKEGFLYFKKDRGMRNISIFMSLFSATGNSTNLMIQAHIQSSTNINTAFYGLLGSAEMSGRMIAGAISYIARIPASLRFLFTTIVYLIYNSSDTMILFVPFFMMLLFRFLSGFLGQTSATIRMNATLNYIPKELRSRILALQNAMTSLALIIVNLIAGRLGEVMEYRHVCLVLGTVIYLSFYLLIIKDRRYTRKIYEAERI